MKVFIFSVIILLVFEKSIISLTNPIKSSEKIFLSIATSNASVFQNSQTFLKCMQISFYNETKFHLTINKLNNSFVDCMSSVQFNNNITMDKIEKPKFGQKFNIKSLENKFNNFQNNNIKKDTKCIPTFKKQKKLKENFTK